MWKHYFVGSGIPGNKVASSYQSDHGGVIRLGTGGLFSTVFPQLL